MKDSFFKNDTITKKFSLCFEITVYSFCATNKTRESINMTMRRLKGFEGLPQIGDKMICLRNYWDILSDDNYIPLVNGTIGYIQSIEEDILPVYY